MPKRHRWRNNCDAFYDRGKKAGMKCITNATFVCTTPADMGAGKKPVRLCDVHTVRFARSCDYAIVRLWEPDDDETLGKRDAEA